MVCGSWVRLRRASSGGPRWSRWSSGRRSAGCTSCAACRSGRSVAERACIERRFGGRCAASRRRAMSGRQRGRGWTRSRMRSIGCCATIRGCRASGSGSCWSRWGARSARPVVDDYLREVRPLFAPAPRTFSGRSTGPVRSPVRRLAAARAGARRARPDAAGWVVVACLGYSRAGAGALIFSKTTPDLLAGIARYLWQLGGLPETLVWDRQAGIHARDGRLTDLILNQRRR